MPLGEKLKTSLANNLQDFHQLEAFTKRIDKPKRIKKILKLYTKQYKIVCCSFISQGLVCRDHLSSASNQITVAGEPL